MSYEDQVYHRLRAEQCRSMSEHASDPEVRRRHEELARLHAGRVMTAEELSPS
ncbi:hypothetical protein ACUXST_002321 [Sphingomonas sp. F9_3S_D5_B_2]